MNQRYAQLPIAKQRVLLALLLIISLLLAACGGGDEPAAADAPAASTAKVTGSGFTCPEPNPRMEVTSQELNLFVWTEYFPEELIEWANSYEATQPSYAADLRAAALHAQEIAGGAKYN